MLRILGLFLSLLALWWILSGYPYPLILGFGLVSVVLAVWLARRMFLTDYEGVPLHLLGRGMLFWPWLLREIWRANITVARIIVSPNMPISPTVFRVPARQKTALGRVLYGNSITLTPGTVTLSVEEDFLEVHALTREGAAELQTDEMGARVRRFEGES